LKVFLKKYPTANKADTELLKTTQMIIILVISLLVNIINHLSFHVIPNLTAKEVWVEVGVVQEVLLV
jgi:diadenosine tetraphosphate (Ap4A) HIT family hydrolase